jgi:predicted nucleic acid-binding protein
MYIVDSGVWIGAANPRDAYHQKATAVLKAILEGRAGKALITNLIFAEVVTYIKRKVGAEESIEVAKVLMDSKHVEIVHVDEHLFNAAYHMFERYPKLSFADAASVAVAKDMKIQRIISFDKDFDGIRDIVRSEAI